MSSVEVRANGESVARLVFGEADDGLDEAVLQWVAPVWRYDLVRLIVALWRLVLDKEVL